MYLGLPALSCRLVPRAGSPACPGLTALGPKKYIGRAASGTEMYLGLSALSYRLVPRAGSPASPGLAALGPEKYTGQGHFNLKLNAPSQCSDTDLNILILPARAVALI